MPRLDTQNDEEEEAEKGNETVNKRKERGRENVSSSNGIPYECKNGQPLHKRRSLPFIEQGGRCVTMWDKSRLTWDSLSRLDYSSAP